MAAPDKGKKPAAASGGKKAGKPSKVYAIEGNKIKRNNVTCPKCGPGVYMAKHKDRITCGHCHYTEFSSRKKE